jgi:hypothetical protein
VYIKNIKFLAPPFLKVDKVDKVEKVDLKYKIFGSTFFKGG